MNPFDTARSRPPTSVTSVTTCRTTAVCPANPDPSCTRFARSTARCLLFTADSSRGTVQTQRYGPHHPLRLLTGNGG
jgi:hypothetical protein